MIVLMNGSMRHAQSMGPSDSDSGAGNETGRPRDHGKAAELRRAKKSRLCVTLT